ncbi:MAG: hypothetical protein VKJ64_00585 [Leptolyngbyaceae bacterium]|nr:hypothetical protein [Leptolyngbyaceae bacterium]
MSPAPFLPNSDDSFGSPPANSATNGHGHPQGFDPARPDASGLDLLAKILAEDSLDDADDALPPDRGERFDRARRSAIKVYVVLIVIGLVIGGVMLVGIVSLMHHFGLTDGPVQVDQQ